MLNMSCNGNYSSIQYKLAILQKKDVLELELQDVKLELRDVKSKLCDVNSELQDVK